MKRVRNPAADGHTLRSARFPLPSTWSADSSSTPSSAREERTHTHPYTHSERGSVLGWHTHICMHKYRRMYNPSGPQLLGPRKDPTLSLGSARTLRHKMGKAGGGSGKRNRFPSTTAYLCKPLQAQTVLIPSAVTTATLTERLECFLP